MCLKLIHWNIGTYKNLLYTLCSRIFLYIFSILSPRPTPILSLPGILHEYPPGIPAKSIFMVSSSERLGINFSKHRTEAFHECPI